MNINELIKAQFIKEFSDRLSIEHNYKKGDISDEEYKTQMMDHDYHYGEIFSLIWQDCTWEEQIQIAVRWKTNKFFQEFLDSVQSTAYKLML